MQVISPPSRDDASEAEKPAVTGLAPRYDRTESGGVAVVIAAYNAAKTIGAALKSALADPRITEVWLIDDASSDDTVTVSRRFDDGSNRLHIIVQPYNRGPAAARNRALAVSRADWLCVLDADDYFLPGRIAKLLAHSHHLDFVADQPMRLQATDPHPPPPPAAADYTGRSIDFAEFIRGNITRRGLGRRELGFIKPLMSRRFLASHGLKYDEAMRLGEDYDLYARALALGATLTLFPPLGYVAVERADSISACHSTTDLARLRDCDHRLAVLRPYTAAERRALRAHYVSVDRRLQWRLLIAAVKTRDTASIRETFTSPKVFFYLCGKLFEQAWVRARTRVDRSLRN